MIGKIAKWLALAVLALAAGVALFLFAMRYSDGPREVFAGGPFRTGEPAAAPADWDWLRERDTIEFQTMDPPTSRTVWLAVHDGRLFLVSGYMNTVQGRLWKRWPHYIEDDDRIVLRIDGGLYERRLERIMDGPDVVPVLGELARKYLGGAEQAPADAGTVTRGDVWMYEVLPRG